MTYLVTRILHYYWLLENNKFTAYFIAKLLQINSFQAKITQGYDAFECPLYSVIEFTHELG